ncbi:MAG TPA: RNA 2',3'-cyclic phosphodiesterase [Burkholderiales bacterium]|nr:RNA 2',3'-cyclic phosphodiesterase [Burkholderiales bacterium]
MRLFFACWPPRETAQALGRWAAEVRNESGGKLTSMENIHLTLAFLGEADADAASGAARRVKGSRHELPVDAARYVKRNQMLWVGPSEAPQALLALAADLRASLARGGFTLEERPFAAHVTLLRKAGRPAAIPPLPSVSWPVDEFLLVSSKSSSAGSTYAPLERFALA